MGDETPSYRRFRFPAEIISHCVWLYRRFPLSFREVEEMMLQRDHRLPRGHPTMVCSMVRTSRRAPQRE